MTTEPNGLPEEPMRTRLLIARILRLLFLQRLSAAIAYQHRTGFAESHRRLLTLVGNYDGLTSAELVALTGSEKAQVSRTVAALTEAGLIERESLRAQITLSDRGRAAFDQILGVAKGRNADLTAGLSEEDLAWFAEKTKELTNRAVTLLARERESLPAIANPRQSADPSPMPARLSHSDTKRPMSQLIAPGLITLAAYLQRSAALTYRHEMGLSNFQSQVLSQIGEFAPVPLLRLVELVDRDKSQVGRTVDKLEEQGLVVRKAARGRAIVIEMTEAGRAVYVDMCRIGIGRNDFLMAESTPAEQARYVGVVEQLTANAECVLAEERAAAAAG